MTSRYLSFASFLHICFQAILNIRLCTSMCVFRRRLKRTFSFKILLCSLSLRLITFCRFLSLSRFFSQFLSGTKITHDARFQRESRCSLCVCCICTKLKSSLFFFERIKKQLLFGNYCFCVCKVSSNSKNTCHLIEIKYWFAKIACQTHRII